VGRPTRRALLLRPDRRDLLALDHLALAHLVLVHLALVQAPGLVLGLVLDPVLVLVVPALLPVSLLLARARWRLAMSLPARAEARRGV
jgi:hypothetical protein